MTGPYERPDFPYADKPAEEDDKPVRPPYIHCQPQVTGIRIGDKIRSLVDDVNVSVGLTGLVVNVAPRYQKPALARVLFENDTICLIAADCFEVLSRARADSE